jgi:hypothetical protein
MSWLRAFSLALCVLNALAAGSARAQLPGSGTPPASDSDYAAEARAHFTRGKELYAAGDLKGTLAEFERAYALRPSPVLSFQIGQVAFELREWARSYRAFAQFLETAPKREGPSTSPSQQAAEQKKLEAEAMIRELRPRIALLRIATNEPGVHLSVDEQAVGDTPLAAPLVLDVGTVGVRASKPGFEPVTRLVTLAGGDDVRLELELEPVEMARAAPQVTEPPRLVLAPPEHAASWRARMTPGLWAGFATAGALVIAGSATGIAGLKASSDLRNRRFTGDSAQNDFSQASNHVRALSISTDVLLSGAFVAAQTSLIMLLWRGRHPRTAERARASVGGSAHSFALQVQGAF